MIADSNGDRSGDTPNTASVGVRPHAQSEKYSIDKSGKFSVTTDSTIRWQFVCDEGIWDKTLLFFNSLRINLSAAFLFLRD